ncbi:cytochrome P450 6d1-like [Stomoxys calcitrans]|uniref:cytochrome P450 6d1-like n=1 Tax=Stomoxys calcitrans TaxID=35570 RepID=UPI0027E30509|nr:cytochrome P450 6d1-like [Stomoxys calcitrans]
MLVVLLIWCLIALYVLIKRHYSKWQRLGFATDEPLIPYGSLTKLSRKERHFGLIIADLYEKYTKDKVVGFYMFFKPTLLVRDAELVRQILTTDFGSFHDRGLYVDEKNDPLTASLFNLEGQSWRTLRTKLTPSFSSAKLKAMFETVDAVGDKMIKYLGKELEDGQSHDMEIKRVTTNYAIDIIGSVIFGLDIDSFSNPNNEFRKLSELVVGNEETNFLRRLRNLTSFVSPPVAKFLSSMGVKDSISHRLRDIVSHTIEYREKHGVIRKDLLQLLIQLRNTGKISEDNERVWSTTNETKAEHFKKAMSIDMIAANSFLFYMAGSETTSATISFTLYEMAMYPDIFAKAQNEVDEILERYGLKPDGHLTYEAIQDMKYLDLCVKETTRKYPALPFLNRQCTKQYQVPDTKLVIPEGTAIIISLLGMHRDPQYFPNPLDYKPERFGEDSKDYDAVAYMPFGDGPRHCVAQRMGIVNSKTALVKVLANFNIEPMPRKEIEFVFHTAPVLVPKDGLNIPLSKRK